MIVQQTCTALIEVLTIDYLKVCVHVCACVCVCDNNDSGESGGYDDNDDNKVF